MAPIGKLAALSIIIVYRSMTNKILGISVLVALVGALAVLALPLYRTLLSNESDIVYAQEQQQTPKNHVGRWIHLQQRQQ